MGSAEPSDFDLQAALDASFALSFDAPLSAATTVVDAPPQTKPPQKPSRKPTTCSLCGGVGHNKRSHHPVTGALKTKQTPKRAYRQQQPRPPVVMPLDVMVPRQSPLQPLRQPLRQSPRQSSTATTVGTVVMPVSIELPSHLIDGDQADGGNEGKTKRRRTTSSHTDDVTNDCVICLDKIDKTKNDAKALKCMHVFHGVCIDKWLGASPLCPVCKT